MFNFASFAVFAVVAFVLFRDFFKVGLSVHSGKFNREELVFLKWMPTKITKTNKLKYSVACYAYIILGGVLVKYADVAPVSMIAYAYAPGLVALTRDWAWSLFKAKKAVDAVAASTSVETETIRRD